MLIACAGILNSWLRILKQSRLQARGESVQVYGWLRGAGSRGV
jgi:hypothetical protein